MPLSIDAEDLVVALEDHSPETHWYLDLSTGEILPLIDPIITRDPSLRDAIDEDPDRYCFIEPMPSREAFLVMESFVNGLPPGSDASRLLRALAKPHPFRAFKDALATHPILRERWFSFHSSEMRLVAAQWLQENQIDAVLSSPMRRNSEA